ncbi:glycosyltransferase (plasmid) [Sphingomonas sp. CJ20]
MLINLAFIKATNGLFYFALDYIAALEDTKPTILVRTAAIADALRGRFPNAATRVMGPLGAARAVLAASRRGEMVFTPSSHPIPGADRQLVVVHDSYPFDGARGVIKAALFFLALRTSRASAGYINLCDARAFLDRGKLRPARLRSTPNHMSPPQGQPFSGPLEIQERTVVGLFGTDSPKKNYDIFFAAVSKRAAFSRLAFRLYGQPNLYIAGIMSAFPDLDISVTDSREIGLEPFLRAIDVVACAATREGFSRPMALALALGIPCWIVDAPVFREFYGRDATFHADVDALGAALAALAPGAHIDRPAFAMPARLEREFSDCIAWLKTEDTHRP